MIKLDAIIILFKKIADWRAGGRRRGVGKHDFADDTDTLDYSVIFCHCELTTTDDNYKSEPTNEYTYQG
jgi:hypothetical protein